MGKKNGISRKEELKQKRHEQEMARAKKQNEAPKKKEKDSAKEIEIVKLQIEEAEKNLTTFVETSTIGGDVEYDYASREHRFMFFGQNSNELNNQLVKKERKIKNLRNRLSQLQNPELKQEKEAFDNMIQYLMFPTAFRKGQLFNHLFKGGPKPTYPKGCVIIERCAVGLILGYNEHGFIAGVRCYHSKDEKDLPCDCEYDPTIGVWTLSPENQHKFSSLILLIDDDVLDMQVAALREANLNDPDKKTVIKNIYAGIGNAVFVGPSSE